MPAAAPVGSSLPTAFASQLARPGSRDLSAGRARTSDTRWEGHEEYTIPPNRALPFQSLPWHSIGWRRVSRAGGRDRNPEQRHVHKDICVLRPQRQQPVPAWPLSVCWELHELAAWVSEQVALRHLPLCRLHCLPQASSPCLLRNSLRLSHLHPPGLVSSRVVSLEQQRLQAASP